jgi:hypothetical protein
MIDVRLKWNPTFQKSLKLFITMKIQLNISVQIIILSNKLIYHVLQVKKNNLKSVSLILNLTLAFK